MADTQCCSSTHSLPAQPSRGYTLDSPTHMHTPSSSAPSSPTYPPTPMTGLSASAVPLLPTAASAKPVSTQASLPARCYAAMRNGARRLFGHGHSHGDKHSHSHGSCGHNHGHHHHGYGLVSTEANDEHHHSHGHSHAHHHHTSDHPHDCDHDHDHEHDDVEVFTDSKHGDYLHLPGRYRVTLTVLGMDCPSCSPRVVRALNDLPSVGECHVDVFAGRATVTYHPDHVDTTEMMQHVTASTGFKCQIVQDGPVGESSGPTRRMRIQLDLPMEEKDPEMRGVKVVQEEQADLIEVEYEAGLNPREVLGAFKPWGGVYVPPAQESSIDSAQREVLRLLHLTTVSAVLCFPVLVFAWAPLPPHPTLYGGISLALTTVIQLYVARPIYVSGIRALTVQRTIDMDLLVALSTGTAYLFSTVAYGFREAGRPINHQGESYFETSALLVTLVMLGRLIAAYARRRSTNAVAQLTSMQVDQATLVQPTGEVQVIPTGLVHINDILRLEPGDRIPTDGRVVSGEGHVDESSITGESAPVLKRSGAVLVAGTVLMGSNRSGLEMRVTLSPDENTLSRMAELMRAAQGARLRVQDTADRVAGWLAPVVLVLGAITFIAWASVGLSAANRVVDATARAAETREAVVDSIGYAVAVLVVSCPCAIALCVPMVAVIAVAVGTRRGVLFKTVEALESAYDVSVVVFDKTGTLTLGKLSVEDSKYYTQDTVPWLGTERGIQSVVRALTGSSTHPVSAAVHEHVVATLASASPLQTDGLDVKSVPGKGVEATVDGVVIRGGSAVWAAGGGVVKDLGDHTVFVVSVAADPAHSVFTCIAYYILSDSLRPDALSTIKSLTQRGLEVHILSGDNHGVVTRTASALGIPTAQARGGCSPEEKGQWIKFLQGADGDEDCEKGCDSEASKRRKVMFVGDGTNDALALVQSDVGVSLGGGTDVASSAAQVVLLSSLNAGLTDVFKLARAARRRVWMNFAWAGMYNAVAILLACGVLGRARIPPQWAGLGELVSVLPVVLVAWSLGVVTFWTLLAGGILCNMESTIVTALLAGATLTGIYLWYQSKSSRIPLPPGPRGNLIFGSALELRTSKAFWINFAKWTERFGPIVSIRMLFQRMIIVDDPKIITYLFEKKASQYSDRYVSQLALLIGWENDIIFIEYGPLLKHYRTLLQRALNNRVVLDYLPLQEHEAKRLLRRLYDTPERFMQHIHLMAGSVAIRMVYGYRVDSPDDRLVQAAEQVMAIFSDMRYIPRWFPGATFHKATASWVPILQATEDETFEYVKSQMAKGVAEPSFTAKLLQKENGEEVTKQEEIHIKSLAASLYGAASDTTVSAVKSFFLAMTLYPDVQAKAQSEIATYLQAHSDKRFITMDDKPHLPYVSALVRETLRWHPVLTLVGHRSNGEDDENVVVGDKTYRIPARTAVIANVCRKIMHNPDVYSNPEKFIPERFLGDSPQPFPESYAFGFGRSKAKDENGAEIVPREDYTNDIITHPLPFVCDIKPRPGYEKWLSGIE
ncbi:Heavy metal translocatin [Rhizoctonia solani]|uniref:Heavy metal translocatin n=1 Tax=Rhizoctonia solani TaxID=456999 RepID=A0A8H7GZR4_9AGAM|nr:Heavy metal translocatin [Rhizoctonia solani]